MQLYYFLEKANTNVSTVTAVEATESQNDAERALFPLTVEVRAFFVEG